MVYRNKAYLCFDGDNDIHYYRLMKAWHENKDFDFSFNDAHDLKQARDSSLEATIKRSLRERMSNSREFIVLVGENTKNLFRFVRWEMEMALKLELPIIAVNLNGYNGRDEARCPAIIRDELVVHIPYGMGSIRNALENWPSEHSRLKTQGIKQPRHYNDSTYKGLAA
jgi:hypothetical protein